LEAAYSWDTGLLREINEDSVLCTSFNLVTHRGTLSAGLFAVADGMGGHNAGEVASDLAIRHLQAKCFSSLITPCLSSCLSLLAAAFDEANSRIFETADEGELHGMGTTLTAAIIAGGDLYVAHIGDSRCYVINSRECIQVTRDHSIVQQLVDDGIITEEQAWDHPRRNEITRVLGYSRDFAPDLYHVKLYECDSVLLCSDGLHGILPLNTIAETILNSPSANQACVDLTSQANLAGGPDNISTIVIRPDNLPSWQELVTSQTGIREL